MKALATQWELVGKDQGYSFWVNKGLIQPLYNVTKNNNPPAYYAGYRSLNTCIGTKNCSRLAVIRQWNG